MHSSEPYVAIKRGGGWFAESVGFVKDNSSFPHAIRLLLEQLDGAA
jgi:hypothetical protein